MRLEKTFPFLRQGKRIYRESWRRSQDQELNELFIRVEGQEEYFVYETNILNGPYKISTTDIIAVDWKVENDNAKISEKIEKIIQLKDHFFAPISSGAYA